MAPLHLARCGPESGFVSAEVRTLAGDAVIITKGQDSHPAPLRLPFWLACCSHCAESCTWVCSESSFLFERGVNQGWMCTQSSGRCGGIVPLCPVIPEAHSNVIIYLQEKGAPE